ncbi:telomere repeat-binding protein 3-like [Lactuca sativa]|uniref:telomere repeat-binding protein 3-like n=1 Tax=Lactuca sativa TaxID=4236 RepID=UPI0022AF9686|nr:telomere repeat-binding protein 3-like [Lactuca sativa]
MLEKNEVEHVNAISEEEEGEQVADSIKIYQLSQRRTRRPFSVSEVQALVEAVETLGAGTWRDVKMRAFDDANHRTYVDLKDKWKTLVHTASISPQQRRGEPVSQELLDWVLAAHAYWSQHQNGNIRRQQCKEKLM